MKVFKILKGKEEITICTTEEEFIQKANGLWTLYCQTNKIENSQLKKARQAELCLYSIGYIVLQEEIPTAEESTQENNENKSGKIKNYEDLTLTAKYCMKCKCMVEPDEDLNCPECGNNIPKMAQEAKEKAQKAADELMGIDEAIDENPHLGKYIREAAKKISEEIEIQKICINKENVVLYVEYDNYNPGKNSKKIVFKGYESCAFDLLKEFQGLNTSVCDILNYPEEWADRITVTGVSLCWKDKDLYGAVLIYQRRIQQVNCPQCDSTPFLRFENEHEKTLSSECFRAITTIVTETKAYMNGKVRAKQMNLFGDDE